MIFVGFGFLMTFLQRYGFGSVGFNFLISAFALQWATIMQGFFHFMHGGKISIGIERYVINTEYAKVVVHSLQSYESNILRQLANLQGNRFINLTLVQRLFLPVRLTCHRGLSEPGLQRNQH